MHSLASFSFDLTAKVGWTFRWVTVGVMLLAGSTQWSRADVPLLSLDAEWRYNQTAVLNGQFWQAGAYDDSDWPVGRALLYWETNVLVSPRNTPLTIGRTTYYFRTHLTCPVDRTNLLLKVSARIDDGAVFYLNGQEIQRVRMAAAPTVISYASLATSTPPGGDAVTANAFTLQGSDLTNLVTGDNLLAVEVHQNATYSDDVVFGTSVALALLNSPPIVFQQPADLAVLDGRPAILSAVVEGNPAPFLQWYKDGIALPGATNSLMFFPASFPTNGGTYWLSATNSLGSMITSNAVLSVLADTNRPAILSVVAQKNFTNVVVSFSEPVSSATAVVSTNYEAFQTAIPSNRLEIVNVAASGASAVVLTTALRVPGVNYSLRVQEVRDTSSLSNSIAANSGFPFSYQADLVSVNAQTFWTYYAAGDSPATNWMTPSWDDAGWSSGAAVFHAGTPSPNSLDPVQTVLPLGEGGKALQTYYFRTLFDLPGPSDLNSLRLHDIADDGAVFYLNGSAVFSIGMPGTGPVDYSTAAIRTVGVAGDEPSLESAGWVIAGTNLTAVGNCLAAEVHQSVSGLNDVAFSANLEAIISRYYPRLQLALPPNVLEGAGILAEQGIVTILEPLTNALVVQLTSSRPAEVSVPASLTIPAGETNATFDLLIGDTALVEGPRSVSVRITGTEVLSAEASLQVLDNETNTISLLCSNTATEGDGWIEGEVRFDQPATVAVSIVLVSSDPLELAVPPNVIIAAGATSAVFQVRVVDDSFLDGSKSVLLRASVPGWPGDSTAVIVEDNEKATIDLGLPVIVLEGTGTLTNAGKLVLGGITLSNVVVTLQTTNPGNLQIPANITIPAGKSNVFFDLTILDNLAVDGDRWVSILTSADGFTPATSAVRIVDNDPHRLRFSAVASIVDTNTVFDVRIIAENADASVQTNFSLSLSLVAEGIEGALLLEPTNSGAFSQGQRTMSVRILEPGRTVRLRSLEYPGRSDAFNVVRPTFYASSQPVADIVWHAPSQTLFASVPGNGGSLSNCLIAIDPLTGLATNSYPLAFSPGQIEASPAGTFLYVGNSDQTRLQRFDLNTRLAGVEFKLGPGTDPVRFAYDFCIAPGLSDSVVVEGRDRDAIGNTSRAGIWRYDSGQAVSLPNFYASGGWRLESLGVGSDVALSPPLVRGNAATGTILATAADFRGTVTTFRAGQLFDDRGNFYSASGLDLLGSYPNVLDQIYHVALPEVNPALRRVFYLSGYFNYGSSMYKLKVYDRDLMQPLCQIPVPSTPGSPSRFLSCGKNLLAYVTGNGQLWFIRPDVVQPEAPDADLALSLSSLPPAAVVGTDYSFSMSLSNAGPGVASLVRVTNALPANSTLVQLSPSVGSVATAGSGFTWNLADLPVGANVTLQVSLRFNTGGWQTNATWALGFEADPVFANNLVQVPLYVQFPPTSTGVFTLSCAADDLLYDPVRDRLLLSVGNGLTSDPGNGLAVLNPFNGLTESFRPLGKRPAKLARTDNGQYLYVSLPDDALIRRLDLATLSQNLDFSLGGEDIYGTWYPFFAGDLAAVPGKPAAVVAWRVRRAGPMASEYGQGIAWFENSVMANNVTESGGNWKLEFDADSGALFAFNNGNLRRCSADSTGVSFTESYPPFYSAGEDLEYGQGHLFTTAGRVLQEQPLQVSWLLPGAETGSLVETDAASGRVFYLVQNNGWQIKAYDMESWQLLGSIPIPNLAGTPASLVRCGTKGLAFRTSSNQLFVVRSSLVHPQLDADLAASLTGPTAPVSVGSDAVFNLVVTNSGPGTALMVQVTNRFSASMELVAVSAGAGSWVTNQGTLTWMLSALEAGAQAELSYTVHAAREGVTTTIASARSTTSDPFTGNNTIVNTMVVGGPAALGGVITLPLPANDMVWSPSLGKLLLTSATNTPGWAGSLFSVDPVSLNVQFQARLGMDAGLLTMSRDDSFLYAGVDYGVSVVATSGLALTNRFLINPKDPRGVAFDLAVVPGADQVVLVGSRSLSDNSTWLGAYAGGIQATNTDFFYSSGLSLEFGDDPSLLFCKDYSGGGLRRYTIDAQGPTLLDSDTTLLPLRTPMDLVWNAGRIYSSAGNVIDPVNRAGVGSIAGIPAGSLVCYDPGSARVFYLCPGAGEAVLKAFDGPTLLPVGSQVVTGVKGALGSLVRWGADGFAFTTSGGQLMLLHSDLVATNPPADVSVALVHSAAPYITGGNITATLLISNSGPNAATSVAWKDTLPAGALIVNAESSLGTIVISSNLVSGSLPILTIGEVATVSITLTAPAPGIITNQVSVTASSVDPAFGNNLAAVLLWIQPAVGLGTSVSLSLPVKDLERDPIRPLLYASFGSSAGALADSVVAIDPVNGNIRAPVRVGSNPGKLCASPDGRFLYVALDGAGMVQKLALPSLDSIGSFPVPQQETVLRMNVSPLDSDMVVLRRTPNARTARTSLHVAGVQQAGELSEQDLFAFSQTTGKLFGCDGYHSNVRLYRLSTGSDGLTLLEAQPGKQSSATDLKSSGGLLFFNGGMVIDPETTRVRAMMPVPYNALVEPDTVSGRVYYLTPLGTSWVLRAFDIVQGIEVGSLPTPFSASAPPRRLLRWGADGLASYTTNSQVVIWHGPLVPTNPPVDVILKQSSDLIVASTNDTLSVSLQLSNVGPVMSSVLVVTQSFSLPISNVILSTANGTAAYTNGVVTWQAGTLATGVVASLNVTLRPIQPGTMNVSAVAYHDLNDPFWGNNTALNVIRVTNTAEDSSLQIRLAARDIVYDSTRDLIYASTGATNRLGGNLVAMVNPATGEMVNALSAGSEPDQLALSDDARFLYVAVNGAAGVQRFDLLSGTADLSFPFGTNDIYFAQDLKVQPRHNDTVAASLGSYNYASGFPSDVIIYDQGAGRPQRGGPARGLAFSADGSYLFGYVSPGMSYGFVRMQTNPDGFLSELMPGFTSMPGELKWSNGRLYSYSGEVVEPYAPAWLGSFSAPGPQTVEEATGRAFSLVKNGANWELRVSDVGTLLPIGTQVVANVVGIPAGLIRCGTDRLAFRTSSNQLYIVHSPLVSTNTLTPANLGVSQQGLQDLSNPTETLDFLIIVTNRGAGIASNVLVTIRPPAPVASTALQAPQGMNSVLGDIYLCRLGSLAPGASLEIILSAVITNTSTYTNFVTVSSSAPDPDATDNTAVASLQGLFFQRADTIRTVGVATRALAYDPAGQRLFAALDGIGATNRIAWFDPQTGLMQGTLTADIAPTTMLITGGGEYLYLAESGNGLVQRVHLPSLSVDLSFVPPEATTIGAMATVPGIPRAIAVTYWTTNNAITSVFDDGVERPNRTDGMPYSLLACATDASALFGYANTGTGGNSPDVFRMALTASGLSLMDNGPSDTPWGYNSGMAFAENRLIFADGNVLNPGNWTEELPFNGGWGGSLTPLPLAQVAFLSPPPGYYEDVHVRIYDFSSRQRLDDILLGYLYSGYSDLTYCGADRLAFRTPSGIFFIRSTAIRAPDTTLSASIGSCRLTGNGSLELSVRGSIGLTYAVETSTNLNEWTRLLTFVCQQTNQAVQVPNSPSLPASFYRLRTLNNGAAQLPR